MIGKWRNVEDIEECLNLDELKLLIEANRDKEYRANRFAAAMKGIDLDAQNQEAVQERFDAVERRARAKLQGITGQELENRDAADILGLRFETDADEV